MFRVSPFCVLPYCVFYFYDSFVITWSFSLVMPIAIIINTATLIIDAVYRLFEFYCVTVRSLEFILLCDFSYMLKSYFGENKYENKSFDIYYSLLFITHLYQVPRPQKKKKARFPRRKKEKTVARTRKQVNLKSMQEPSGTNLTYQKSWQLNTLPQCLANLTPSIDTKKAVYFCEIHP